MVIQRETLKRYANRGQFTASDGRVIVGDIMRVPLAERVAAGLYELATVEGDAEGYEWDDATGVCTFTSLPTIIDMEDLMP